MPDVIPSVVPPMTIAPAASEPAGVVVSAPSVTPVAPSAPLSVAEASKAFLAGLTPEQQAAPLADPVPVEAADDAPVTLDFDAPTFDEASGQWRNKDGTFAPAPSEAAADASPEGAAPASDPTDLPAEVETPPAIVVGLKARDGSVKEIEVTDQETADLLRANANDGMRRDEFNRRIEGVQQKEAQAREFETMLRTNPEHVFTQLPADAQARLAESIIAQHWDAIVDRIVRMDQDPTYRTTVAAEARVRQVELTQQTQQAIEVQRYAATLERGVRALIPESVDEATAERFLADASNDLAAILPTRAVQPSELAQVLAPRLALYRFEGSAEAGQTGGTSSTATPSAPPVIRATPRAPASVASGSVAPVTPVVAVPRVVDPTARAQATTQRMAQTQTQRAVAAAVAPAGAGAAPVKVSVPVHATVEEASKYVRSQLGNRW